MTIDSLLGDGVRICPSSVEFYDVEAQVVHQMQITVQNLSKTSKLVRFLPPITEKFRVHCKETEKTIAPGLHLSALVEYYNDVEEDCEDHVVFMVGDDFVEVPLVSYSPKPILTISGSVDFGTTVADRQVFTEEIAVLNHGTKCGNFKIIPKPSLPFQIMPVEGTVNPGYSQPIRFEFISKDIGSISDEYVCELEGQKPGAIEVRANVVDRSLHLLNANDIEMHVDCVSFGTTYYGTDVLKTHVLYNSSPYETSFVAIIEDGSEGEEMGIDVTKNVHHVDTGRGRKRVEDPSYLVSMIPNQGILLPFQKVFVHFKFSPRFNRDRKGWKHKEKLPPREDYAMFMKIQAVMSVTPTEDNALSIELALTGTALPVSLSILPSPELLFDECDVGGREESVLELKNHSPGVPVCYAVRKVAHFHAHPVCGYIEAEESKDLTITFQPKQIGKFNCDLLIDMIGQVCEIGRSNEPVFKKAVIETQCIRISGKASALPPGKGQATSHSSNGYAVAHPNDRASSIRPSDGKQMFKTQFTKLARYTYVDTDYSYTEKEQNKRSAHQKKYGKLLSSEAQNRKQKKLGKEYEKINNDTDLGIKPGLGLRPPKVSVRDIFKEQNQLVGRDYDQTFDTNRLLTSKSVGHKHQTALMKKASEGLNALPSTGLEKEACQTPLSPQELFQVVISPTIIDFGDVCRKSVCCMELKIMNNTNKIISIQLDINCRELRQTSPISQVIPADTVAKMEFIFESAKVGKFERNINYLINGIHKSHLLVHANVVTVGLELSTDDVVLQSAYGMSSESGLRKCVSLINKLNMAAEFTWSPILKDGGTSFTIRPAKGIVEPFSTLDCEVVFYPSYSANYFGEFSVNVEHGNQLSLRCSAHLGPTSCTFVERRLMFGALPLNLVTVRSAFLRNTSNNHAYFKVVDENPVQGMLVRPREGVVPVGGFTELQVTYKPEIVHKFDTQIEVDVLGWKMISLRMGGHVEVPSVDIDIGEFNFGGIYCGAKSSISFQVSNSGRSNVQVTFDLSMHQDFEVKFVDQSVNETVYHDRGYYSIHIPGQGVVSAILQFSPTEVAAYDFVLPVNVNHQQVAAYPPISPPPSSSTSRTYTVANSKGNTESTYQTIDLHIPAPSRRIQATGLRAPLQISAKNLEFVLPSTYFDLKIHHSAGRLKSILLVNNSMETLTWRFDVRVCQDLFEDGIFAFLFKTGSSSNRSIEENSQSVVMNGGEAFELRVAFNPIDGNRYSAQVPVILNDNPNPYTYLYLSGELTSTSLAFVPSSISFNTVPLLTTTEALVQIVGHNFSSETPIHVEIPQVELEDGSMADVFEVVFRETNVMSVSSMDPSSENLSRLTCAVKFSSKLPVSFSAELTFSYEDKIYFLPVQGCADNCLFSCFNFLCSSESDFHIVCERMKQRKLPEKNDLNSSEETVFIPCVSPIRLPTDVSMITSSTPFSLHSTVCEESTIPSTSESSSNGEQSPVDMEEFSPYEYTVDNIPESDTEEWKVLKDVMKTVQRWYSAQCWSNGYYPVVLPYSLRNSFSAQSLGNTTTRAGSWNREHGKKHFKNIIDIIDHLCGKPVPGLTNSVNMDSSSSKRLHSILTLYSSLLAFLRCQGAMVSTIKPEHLLDQQDYQYYTIMIKGKDSIDGDRYEFLSRKAWTELMLQILKVLVLARITPQQYKKALMPSKFPPLPAFNPDPLCSNVYSISERIILAWVNHIFEHQRVFWRDLFGAEQPASRWIVNFENDFVDGLVLASLLAAYCPYVVKSHLSTMYTRTQSAEQCLHNNLKVVEAFRFLGFDFDVLATDITEPNGVGMLLLCMYLFQKFPQYLPKSTVELKGSFQALTSKKIKLQNPSSKILIYEAVISGEHSCDFSLPGGSHIQVPPKGEIHVAVEYKSRSLKPCESTLVLVVQRFGTAIGSALAFNLRGCVDNIVPSGVIKCTSPCYELKKLVFTVENPYGEAGTFKVVLAETTKEEKGSLLPKKKEKKDLKKTASKTDHGQPKRSPFSKKSSSENVLSNMESSKKGQILSAFWSPKASVDIGGHGKTDVEIHFLPFHVGALQCSVLFVHETIGEFLYSIEADSTLPLPSMVPFKKEASGSSIRVSSATAVLHSQGMLEDDNRIVYLHCEAEKENHSELGIMVRNDAKEKALMLAARQRMSEKELKRRELTGITSSDTIINSMASLLLTDSAIRLHPQDLLGVAGEVREFSVELSSPYFRAPKTLQVRVPEEGEDEPLVKLPLTVLPSAPGQYPCSVILRAPNDIRVYHVESTIKHSDSSVQLEFESPTHQVVVQNVPIINHSDVDWHLEANITGEGFSGPETFIAEGHMTSNYPLSFLPIYEGGVSGYLILRNTSNGAENSFHLTGKGTEPLSLEEISIDCIVNETTMKVVEVTNNLNHKVVFQTFSDLDMISGPPFVTVLPKRTVQVPITITTKKRGCVQGCLTFIHDAELTKFGVGKTIDSDSDSEDGKTETPVLSLSEMNTYLSCKPSQFADISQADKFQRPYRIWYSIKINSIPSSSEQKLEICSPIHQSSTMELQLKNPLDIPLCMDVVIQGSDLYGELQISIPAMESIIYQLHYQPTTVGESKASVIFQGESLAEFWYDISLLAEQPLPQTLPTMQCVLGQTCTQIVTIPNPFTQPVVYKVSCSNEGNFEVGCVENEVYVLPSNSVDLPITFRPSAIGEGNHSTEITFINAVVGCLTFLVAGIGDPPEVSTDHIIQVEIGGNASTIIVFHNPFDCDILVDVDLKPKMENGVAAVSNEEFEFSLLLKVWNNLVLPSKAVIDIPISYAPDNMEKHEAVCVVKTRPFLELGDRDVSNVAEVCWTYIIQGIPIRIPVEDGAAPVLVCQARDRKEEKLEISFFGMNNRTVSEISLADTTCPIRILGQHAALTRDVEEENILPCNEFKYKFQYADADAKDIVSRAVGLTLKRATEDGSSGMVTLLFDLIFAPSKSFSHLARLIITSPRGGVWKYPIRFKADKPVADDVIFIKSIGLNKESLISFRINSQSDSSVQFEAFFANGSDPMFTVSPSSGMLASQEDGGTLMTLSYKPMYYGKVHQGKLLIQTRDSQWMYEVKGITPDYKPPKGKAATENRFSGSLSQHRKQNFVRDNLRVVHTGVSSPLKGKNLLQKASTTT